MAARGLSLAANPKYCHICGFRISQDIVSSGHPLFGTIDHYYPLSRGGKNVKANRYPAHGVCNRMKSSKTMPLESEFLANVQGVVIAAFRKAGLPNYATDKELRAARARIGFDRLTKDQRREWSIESSWDFHRWAGEGGYCLDYLLDTDQEAC